MRRNQKNSKFNGQNFKRWQQKMFFYLTTLGLARFLKETVPQVEPPAEGQSSNAQAVKAWKHSDFLCHNYVLNGSAPELVKRETDTRVTCTVDALKHSETLCAITMRYMLRMERLNLGNSPTANIKGKGDVIHIWKRV
ncbi:hypothetical protein Tco_0914272 [Tanacetum coccineum]